MKPESQRQRKLLGIDIENVPDWYGGGDFVYDRVVCISWKWVGTSDDHVQTAFLDWRKKDKHLLKLLKPLREAIETADAFLGHNFGHDTKGLRTVFNMLEQPFLPARMEIVDTMRCIPPGMPRGLEYLCSKFGFPPKPHLDTFIWTQALARYVPEAIEMVKHRNAMDVILTEMLYWKEIDLGWMRRP